MKVMTSIHILGPLEKVFGLAEDVIRWPEIMPHYKYVKLLDEYGNKKVLEMAAYVRLGNNDDGEGLDADERRGIVPVKWTAIQESIPEERTMTFFHIKGPMKDMEVEWSFGAVEYNNNSIVEINANYTFNRYLLIAKYTVGNFFIHNPLSKTLACLKEIVEAETMAAKPADSSLKKFNPILKEEDYKRWPVLKDIYA